MTLKTVKYASARYYDSLPTSGSEGGRAFRDLEMEGAPERMLLEPSEAFHVPAVTSIWKAQAPDCFWLLLAAPAASDCF